MTTLLTGGSGAILLLKKKNQLKHEVNIRAV
jgi:hypothetical protein